VENNNQYKSSCGTINNVKQYLVRYLDRRKLHECNKPQETIAT